MGNKKCSLKVLSNNGKTLSGTAAQLKYVSDNGGWDAYIEKVASDAAKIAVKHAFNNMKKAKFTKVKSS